MINKIVKVTKNSYEVMAVNAKEPAFKWGPFHEIREKHGLSTGQFAHLEADR